LDSSAEVTQLLIAVLETADCTEEQLCISTAPEKSARSNGRYLFIDCLIWVKYAL
jgi:hypothetical protein